MKGWENSNYKKHHKNCNFAIKKWSFNCSMLPIQLAAGRVFSKLCFNSFQELRKYASNIAVLHFVLDVFKLFQAFAISLYINISQLIYHFQYNFGV